MFSLDSARGHSAPNFFMNTQFIIAKSTILLREQYNLVYKVAFPTSTHSAFIRHTFRFRFIGLLFLPIIAAAILTACSSSNQQASSDRIVTAINNGTASALQVSTVGADNLTPIPVTVNSAVLSPLSTPSGGRGTVVGRVYKLDGRTVISSTSAFLAKVYWNNDHSQGVFALDVGIAPKTQLQDNGDFMFTNIENGDYTFVVGNPDHHTAVLSQPDGSVQIFKVTEGQITSLGNIKLNY